MAPTTRLIKVLHIWRFLEVGETLVKSSRRTGLEDVHLSLLAYVDVLRLRPAVEGLHLVAHLADVFQAHIKQLPPWRLARQCHLRIRFAAPSHAAAPHHRTMTMRNAACKC